jgi:putative transposase
MPGRPGHHQGHRSPAAIIAYAV